MNEFTDEQLTEAYVDGAVSYGEAMAEGAERSDAIQAGNRAAAMTLGVSPERAAELLHQDNFQPPTDDR